MMEGGIVAILYAHVPKTVCIAIYGGDLLVFHASVGGEGARIRLTKL